MTGGARASRCGAPTDYAVSLGGRVDQRHGISGMHGSVKIIVQITSSSIGCQAHRGAHRWLMGALSIGYW